MNALVTPFRQLVDRKLWPLAILLVAALAALPMVLGKDEPPVPAPLASTGAAASAAAAQAPTQPIVSLGDATAREARRKVLGARKNPFEPKVKAKKAASTTSTAPAAAAPAAPKTGSTSPSKGTPTTPKPVTPVQPVGPAKPTYAMYALMVQFGPASDDSLGTRLVRRLTAFPRMSDPKLLYLGIKPDRKTVVFVANAGTRITTEGECYPSRDNCHNLELRAGDATFVDVLEADGSVADRYELEIARVLKGTTTDRSEARDWRLGIARGGRDALRASFPRLHGWEFNRSTGFLIEP